MNNEKISKISTTLLDYLELIDSNLGEFKDYKYVRTYKDFLFERKLAEELHEIINRENYYFSIDSIVMVDSNFQTYNTPELLLEWEQYKRIPKTNMTYRFDSENTNTLTQDHIHVFYNNNQLYAINRNGTPHDGSHAQLGKKEMKFLKSIGFSIPENGLLEWTSLDDRTDYWAYRLHLLLD